MTKKYENLNQVADDAIAVQNASNYRGVATSFAAMVDYFNRAGDPRDFSDEQRRAIYQLVTYKMTALTYETEPMELGPKYMDALRAVREILYPTFKTAEEFRATFPRLIFEDSQWAHIKEAVDFAVQRGIQEKLNERFVWLNGYGGDRSSGCRISKDRHAPYSFDILMLDAKGESWFNGGLIYFGKGETGVGGPQFSVRIGDTDEGWSVHT